MTDAIAALRAEVAAAAEALPEGDATRGRLEASVLRPLSAIVGAAPAGAADGDGSAERLWDWALRATELSASPTAAPELREAAAALQDLACAQAPERAERLRERAGDAPPSIQVMTDGPYLVANVARLRDWLGRELPSRPLMALCRCGRSQRKPLCDGTHAAIGFSGAKEPGRAPDRPDRYPGVELTVLDNRGTCQHSGFCTARAPGVFHADGERFVSASGGRLDEIVRAVRDCPSGALSYEQDGVEQRAQVDRHGTRPPAIEVSKDGPYRVTGAIALLDGTGLDEPRNAGASREHYALCRCGRSQNKPFCSGMHWYAEFRDPVTDGEAAPTPFEWCGGFPALNRMTRLFYTKHVPEDPLLAPLFAEMAEDHPERVARWLGEVLGGPPAYSEAHGGYARMLSRHMGKALTEEQRARWVQLLSRSAQEAGLPADPEFRSAFVSYLEWGSRLALENSQPGARPPRRMPMPRWDWGTAGPPGVRVSALAPPDAEPEPALPGPGEAVGFEHHIRPLFRERDRRSMRFAFDLWSYDDVAARSDDILARLRSGSMPCDGPWPPERVEVFARWCATGRNP